MGTGGSKQLRAELNVTPMIDVLLVLLIICMFVLPQRSRGLDSLVPDDSDGAAKMPQEDIVIRVSRDQKLLLNQEELILTDLDSRLRIILKRSPDPVMFVHGDGDIDFADVAQVIDIAKGVGVKRVALITH